jgi:hypothetical protein
MGRPQEALPSTQKLVAEVAVEPEDHPYTQGLIE